MRSDPGSSNEFVGVLVGIDLPGCWYRPADGYRPCPLTDAACRNAKPAEALKKLSDGGGLQLWVQPTGGKLWRLAYRYGGKQKLLAIGPYPLVSLSDARQAREDAKKRANRSERTLDKNAWLLGLAYPELGKRSLETIKAADIFPMLQAVEPSGRLETARQLRSTIGSIFRYAISTGRGEADPKMAFKDAPTVPPRAVVTEPKKLGGLLRAIDGFNGQPTTHAALKLMAILFPRPGELRAAEWSEFDFEKAEWIIPAIVEQLERDGLERFCPSTQRCRHTADWRHRRPARSRPASIGKTRLPNMRETCNMSGVGG